MRIQSVDGFRVIAILAVIIIHTKPFFLVGSPNLGIFLNQISRFAVPFFFVISGYFFTTRVNQGSDSLVLAGKTVRKLFLIFITWNIIYLLPYNIASISTYGLLGPIKLIYWKLQYFIKNPLDLLFQGTKVHLWFLVSLAICTYICAFFIKKGAYVSMIVIGIVLYIIGVFAKAYSATPLGISFEFNTRNGPFLGLLLYATGCLLANFKACSNWLFIGLIVFLVGVQLHFLELFFLQNYFDSPPYHDYVFGTFFMGVGVALMALSNHSLLSSNSLSNVGQMTLGIYASHYIYVDNFKVIANISDSYFLDILLLILVFLASWLTTILLSRYTTLKVK